MQVFGGMRDIAAVGLESALEQLFFRDFNGPQFFLFVCHIPNKAHSFRAGKSFSRKTLAIHSAMG